MTSRQSFGDFPPKSIIFLIFIVFGSFLVDIKNTRYHKPNAMQICTNQSPKFEQTCKKNIVKSLVSYKIYIKSIYILTSAVLDTIFARHSLGGYFKLMSAEVSSKISYNYPQIESSKDRAKHETVLKISGL